ncbi:putative N-acetyltransferase YhbS [Amycolatopsis bartoniae]|uniref:N-acetyltransferase n=1 Tax=Amycolatopsis bartoniae TaxID=941986 RepID=A0A8H9IYM0_9PSEU|nr:GNAT family N-acetyltransferase [Amycolatopsis bartoniae]MBB2937326.1 putative N-acetyltransferase YhbS [Amycolatopsis bartoniae]TVT07962.1 GNAT family N-acetyltransferase [Amycolatopsis bartoniae]GHF78189.1 N-acetyltransferase [Amycolatopsis bartoniae]
MDWKIDRVRGDELDLDEVLAVYHSSGLGERRPVADRERMAAMVANANLVLVCRIDGELAGIARAVSDFSYVTYLSDIAVAGPHQRRGIGIALIDALAQEAPQAKIVLLSAPGAREYYPHIGFSRHESAWLRSP